MREWSNDEKNKYIDTYTKPDSNTILQVTDFEKENNLKKKLKNDIYKEAGLLTMNIINKYFNIRTFDCTDSQYKTTYDEYKFCLIPLYIALNKESSDRLLNVFKKLTKTIFPSITLIKHNDPSFPNQ